MAVERLAAQRSFIAFGLVGFLIGNRLSAPPPRLEWLAFGEYVAADGHARAFTSSSDAIVSSRVERLARRSHRRRDGAMMPPLA